MFQDAFGWSLVGKMNVATSHLSTLDLFGALGGNYLLSQVTSFKQGDDTITAVPVSNGEGQSALYGETGIQWKYLNTDIMNAYSNKTDILNPPFDISIGYRQDKRFNRSGDLSSFLHPDRFVFFRFAVGLNKIGNWSGDQVLPGKGYTFKFGIDYERPIGDGNMPTSTRYYVSANVDVVNLFKPPAPTQNGVRPTVVSISPTSGKATSTITVTITGKDFGQAQSSSTVVFGTKNAPLVSWGQTTILVTMPQDLVAGTAVPVVVTVGGLQSNNDVQFTPSGQ
jgi:hypothetical protein